ncbi:unnamed protein product [Zymoseptoria tritici ST99CH_3D7]|uniref:Zn(2)-C6 fungal-type domain-containing protein n=1 Tax=Zymoseptoria tritici (strain ST99CH_3D7) TaxID=1276538 RepID=A0A1X7RYT6_ZYMT9|nr:unnamed protein product [Zymoseptoria tritici ST99CH_3D7]
MPQNQQDQQPRRSASPTSLPLRSTGPGPARPFPSTLLSSLSSSSRQRPQQLQRLAPRDEKPAQSSRGTSEPSRGRPPRLSHRSRAGCWTCRGRKVKCDETHPRCGPCSRLNRECDWEHRWAFNDATPVTQGKYANIKISGNVVWDPSVQASSFPPASRRPDDLPEFAALTTNEDRERKAETRRPGTFSVVATPESFYDLPEYACVSPSNRPRGTHGSSRGALSGSRPGFGRAQTFPDPNTVLLDRFEETSPTSLSPSIAVEESRSGSVPDILQHLSLTTPPPHASTVTSAPPTPVIGPDDHLLNHFRNYIAPRLTQPQLDTPFPTRPTDIFEAESVRFRPLYHAICAIAGLNLAYNGRASMEDSMQHYHRALAVQSTATGTPQDLLSDGVFFRHFLLFVYDICIPMQTSSSSGELSGADMWAEHLSHLRLLALQRFHRNNASEPHAHLIWTICELDMYACLLGCGKCDFVQTVLSHGMLPPIERQIPPLSIAGELHTTAFVQSEVNIFPAVLRLNEGIVLRTAKIAQTAQIIRAEASEFENLPIPPQIYARWRAAADGLNANLQACWEGFNPKGLLNDRDLPQRLRFVLENATLLYHAAASYVLTTLHPSQPAPPAILVSQHVTSILNLAQAQVTQMRSATSPLSMRPQVFALLVAAFATPPEQESTRRRCVEIMERLERGGIGIGASRVRRVVSTMGDWRMDEHTGQGWGLVGLLRRTGVGVVNCGV